MSDAWNEKVIKEALKSGAERRFLGASILVSHTWHLIQSNGNHFPSYEAIKGRGLEPQLAQWESSGCSFS